MLQFIKNLIPIAVRNRLRPFYRRSCQMVVNSSIWPEPSEWREKKKQLNGLSSIEEYYRFASEELGIVQNKSEIIPFLEFVSRQNPEVIGEIGMKEGGNSFLFMRTLNRVKKIISLDLEICNEKKIRFFSRQEQKLLCINGDSHSSSTVKRVKKALGGEKFDFLFIDGDHSYEGVKEDFLLYAPLVKDGGVIAFHDIIPDHSTRYGLPQGNCYAGGVYILWGELKKEYVHFEFVENPEQNGFGIGAIIKK